MKRHTVLNRIGLNETEDLKRILALSVDGINTDNPDRLFALLK